MKYYTSEEVRTLDNHNFHFIEVGTENHTLTITLNRADKKNALHPQMVNEIAYAMHHAHYTKDIWIVLIEARGNVFCAGADLKAMAGIIEAHESTIPTPKDDVLIGDLFNTVLKPTIAKVTGDVYAGGFFFLAGCNIVVAQDDVKFGLPEVKRGLYPFQVMAALLKVMPDRKVIDWCIRGYNLPVKEAATYGLVTQVSSAESIDEDVDKVILELLKNSPSAISKGLEAYHHLYPASAQHKYLYDLLQQTITSEDGREGLKAWREKRFPEWKGL